MISRMLVGLWLLVYGKFRLRGAGALIRLFYPVLPGLKAYPLAIPGIGNISLDFADGTAYSLLLRFKLGDMGTDIGLYRAMEKYLRPGTVFWDVGAYVGYISAYFAHPKHKLKSIHSFEPNPGTLTRLRSIFAGNKIVTIHPFALGSSDATLELSARPNSASMASLVIEGDGEKIPINVRRGDAAQKELNLPLPDVIKIDVEGFEPEVIKGLAGIIAAKRPVIFFEHIFLSCDQIEELLPSGYHLFFICDDGSIVGDMAARQKGHDAFLVPKERNEGAWDLNKTSAPAEASAR